MAFEVKDFGFYDDWVWVWVWRLELKIGIRRFEIRIEDWDGGFRLGNGNVVLTMCIGVLGFVCRQAITEQGHTQSLRSKLNRLESSNQIISSSK